MSDNYHDRPEISNSQLKTFLADGPAMYEAKHISKTIQTEPTESMLFGTDVHMAVLEPDKFRETVIEIPSSVLTSNGQRRGGKWDEFEANNIDKRLLRPKDMSEIAKCVHSLESNEVARRLLWDLEGFNEVPFLDHIDASGLKLRGKLDRVIDDPERDRTLIVDLKTMPRMGPMSRKQSHGDQWLVADKVTSHCYELGYHRQQFFYRMLVAAAKGVDLGQVSFIFVAVTTEPPYEVQVFQMSPLLSDLGGEHVRRGLDALAERYATGDWKSPTENEIILMEPPKWAR